jgi:serine phosphatase RsbU (regulator of sigma subunit)/anti-sigma regulatory factor (Ser/Thr protein kinase)
MIDQGRAEHSHAAALPRDVAAARAELRARLDGQWPGDLDGALIAFHEAMINADRHGHGIRDVFMSLEGDRLRVSVGDFGRGFDPDPYVRQPPDLMAERGRGLWLIHQVASGFVCEQEAEGSRIVLEFEPGRAGVTLVPDGGRSVLPPMEVVAEVLMESLGAAVAIVDPHLMIRAAWGRVEEILGITAEQAIDRDARGLTAELKGRFQDSSTYEQRIMDIYAQPDAASDDLFVRSDGTLLRRVSRPFLVEGQQWRMVGYTPVAEQTQVVARVQRALLPSLPDWDDLEVGAIYHPAEASAFVGGDFFDFIELSSGARCLVVGDVSGRGPAAAATSTHVRAYLRAALRSHGVTAAVADLDATLAKEFGVEDFVTLAMCVQESAEVWTHTNAGHVPLLLLRDGEVREYGLEGGALGIGLPPLWPREPFTLERGDVLLLMTDGVIDAGRRDLRYGMERLSAAFKEVGGMPAQDLVQALDARIHGFAANHLDDDHVLVAVRRR